MDKRNSGNTGIPAKKGGDAKKQPGELLTAAFSRGKVLSLTFAPKAFQAILGPIPAQILQTFVYMLSNPDKYGVEEYDGHKWLARSRQQLAEWIVVPKATIFGKGGPMERLEELRLIYRKSFKETTFWRVDFDRLALFLLATLVLYSCKTALEWDDWARTSGIVEAFTYRKKGAQGDYRVSAFPGYQGEVLFKNKTPFSMRKHEEGLRDQLIKTFKKCDQKFLTELCYGANSQAQVGGHHPITPGWAPYRPRMGTIPPLGVSHPSTGMDSILPNGQNGLEVPMKKSPLEDQEHNIRAKDKEHTFGITHSRTARCDVGGPTSYEWDEESHLFPKYVEKALVAIFGEEAGEKKQTIQEIAGALHHEFDHNYPEVFSDQKDFLDSWYRCIRRNQKEILKPNHLYPHQQYAPWRKFSERFGEKIPVTRPSCLNDLFQT